jgi:hypothetical protein
MYLGKGNHFHSCPTNQLCMHATFMPYGTKTAESVRASVMGRELPQHGPTTAKAHAPHKQEQLERAHTAVT